LIRENNQVANKTITYSYDNYGNVTSQMTYSFTTSQSLPQPSFMETFTYDSVWKDRLYQYKYWIGTTLNYTQTYSYDNAGNVTSISDSRGSAYSSEYTWEGRTLTGVSLGGSTTDIAYAYNQNGIRIEKTVNGTVTTQYLVDGSRVLYESNGTNTLYYTYDVDGSLISFNYNGTDYFYVYNALGDIVKLLNASGQVVVEYRYDAFGNILFQTTGTLASANPYRYRGYRYDEETKLYYLNSRYYNPQTGRFLNADGLLQGSQTTLGFNLFAYVENNPVVNIDPSGYCSTQDVNNDGIFQDNENPLCGGKAQGQGTPQFSNNSDGRMSGGNTNPTVVQDGVSKPVFRGGESYSPSPSDLPKGSTIINPGDNIGVSVNTDPTHRTVIGRGLGVYQVNYLPEGLDLQYDPRKGNYGHTLIIPSESMSIAHYIELLLGIRSSPYK
jgi:RHS repeat-associated protein